MRRASILTMALCVFVSQGCAPAFETPHAQPQPASASRALGSGVEPVQEAQGPSLKARIGRMFTGAVVGGWLGYFASHLVVSDWESSTGIASSRGAWAAAGVALGAVAGRLVMGGGSSPDELRPGVAAARQTLERDEIIASGASDAYQLVRSLRKEWLIPRGVNSFRESARGTADFDAETVVVPGADHILVYLDNTRLGGTQFLADVGIEMLGRLEFIPPSEATFRWGTGHAHGVILLTTMSAEIDR